MKYTRYELNPYHLHVIQTDKFKTITVQINFKRKIEKSEITKRNLLNDVLLMSTKKYPTKRAMGQIAEDLYAMSCYSNFYVSGNYSVISFVYQTLSDEYTEEGLLKKFFDFICATLFEPNVNNKAFEHENFEIAKNGLRDILKSDKESPRQYSKIRMLETMDPTSPLSFRVEGYLDDLDKINENNLYETYQDMLRSDLVDIFVVGKIEPDQIKQLCLEKIQINTKKKNGVSHFITHTKYHKRPKVVIEKEDIHQSQLVMGCKLIGLTDIEWKYVISLYSFLLGGGPDSKLFKNVREKNSLCYTVSSQTRPITNLLLITAGIDYNDFKKAVSLIKKEMKAMEKGNFTEKEFMSAKETYINSCKEILDSPANIISNYISHAYLGSDLLEDKMREIDKITPDMVVQVAKKVHLDTVYLLEGGKTDAEA